MRLYKLLFRQLISFATDRGISLASNMDLDALTKFRVTWDLWALTASKSSSASVALTSLRFDGKTSAYQKGGRSLRGEAPPVGVAILLNEIVTTLALPVAGDNTPVWFRRAKKVRASRLVETPQPSSHAHNFSFAIER
jgi:hypothetical protein